MRIEDNNYHDGDLIRFQNMCSIDEKLKTLKIPSHATDLIEK